MPDPAKPGKPANLKPRRFWLYAPYAAALVAALGYSAGWLAASQGLADGLDKAAAGLRAQGYQISWARRTVGGWPFRLDVTLIDARIAEPSGWAIQTPELKAEAYTYAADHWLFVVPQSLTVTRPGAGPVTIAGQALRASLAGPDDAQRLSIVGDKLTFVPAPGAAPFAFAAADQIELHLEPGPDDQAALLFRLNGATPAPGGVLARIASARPVSIQWDSIISRRSALKGASWPAMVRAWSAAGGAMTVRHAGISAGDVGLGGDNGRLTVSADGRVQGALNLTLQKGPAAIALLGQAPGTSAAALAAAAAVAEARRLVGGPAALDLTFEAGQTTLGPVRIGPAPRVF